MPVASTPSHWRMRDLLRAGMVVRLSVQEVAKEDWQSSPSPGRSARCQAADLKGTTKYVVPRANPALNAIKGSFTDGTLVSHALAGEAECTFIHQPASAFVEIFTGVGAARVGPPGPLLSPPEIPLPPPL